jgi:tRNA-guanine family transglycosylase
MSMSTLMTRRGDIPWPAFVPVTTFGGRYPLDDLVRPYLPRLAPAAMVSLHYARQMDRRPDMPLFVDSGGFAALKPGASIHEEDGLGVLVLEGEQGTERVDPLEVLELQERLAEVAFTLDFPIPPGTDTVEAERRRTLSVANARWALGQRRRRDLPLFAVLQGWDAKSLQRSVKALADGPFEGFAIGGLVPRARDEALVFEMVDAVREVVADRPLHVLGLGQPQMVRALVARGVTSVDSSSYVRSAVDGRLFGAADLRVPDASPVERLHLALCNLASLTGATLPLPVAPGLFRTALLAQMTASASASS